jgi:CubicO group peptidase (beta-lactamase class C family)
VIRAATAAAAAVLGAVLAFGASATELRAARPGARAPRVDPAALASRAAARGAVLGRIAAAVDATGSAGVTGRSASALSEGIPMRAPTAVGMSAERLAAVDRIVLRGVAAGGYPGASVVVGRRGYAVVKRGYGTLGWGANSDPVSQNTIYDLASLTKVVGTTTAIMVLYDEGKLDLDAPVRHYLPAFAGGSKDRVTLRHLLTHRSGLPAGRELWRSARTPAEARRQVLETPLYCRPGDCFEYSDLGADILGFVAEAVSGRRLDAFLAERVFAPLGMDDTYFRVPTALRSRVAPTEVSPPRGYPLRGEVHDENAYALGGIVGHAGLFSTAADLSVFAQMMLNGGEYGGVRVLADSTVRRFTRRAAGTRALGWDTCDGKGGCGSLMNGTAYGHTGFTGTSLWIDPERNMFVVLLTNRVHAARARRPAKVISDVRADLADAAQLAILDDPQGVRAMPVAFRADEAAGWNRETTSESPPSATRGITTKRGKAARSTKAAKAKAAKAKRGRSAKAAKAGKGGERGTRGAKAARSAKKARSGESTRSARSAKAGASGKSSTRSAAKGARGGKASKRAKSAR